MNKTKNYITISNYYIITHKTIHLIFVKIKTNNYEKSNLKYFYVNWINIEC